MTQKPHSEIILRKQLKRELLHLLCNNRVINILRIYFCIRMRVSLIFIMVYKALDLKIESFIIIDDVNYPLL